jgi:phosphoadenosine phosphosulfate reductase
MSPSISSGYGVENEGRTESVSSEGSEYGSMAASAILPEVIFTPAHLKFLNQQLSRLEPEDIIRWCLISLPGLFQTTALGLTGAFPNTSEQY